MCTNQSRSPSMSSLVFKGIPTWGWPSSWEGSLKRTPGGPPSPESPWGWPQPGRDPYPGDPGRTLPRGDPTPGGLGGPGEGKAPSQIFQTKPMEAYYVRKMYLIVPQCTSLEKCTSIYLVWKLYLNVPQCTSFESCTSLYVPQCTSKLPILTLVAEWTYPCMLKASHYEYLKLPKMTLKWLKMDIFTQLKD